MLKMAEYIDRDAALSEIERREALMVGDKRVSVDAMKSFIKNRPAVDVAPVVRCKDCENSYYAVDDLICSYGPCVDCPVSPDFWCANGRRREDYDAQD